MRIELNKRLQELQKKLELINKISIEKNQKNLNHAIYDSQNNSFKKDKYNVIKPLDFAIEIVVSVLFGSFLGIALDRYFSTKPIFLLIFLAFGIIVAIYNLVKMI